MPDSTQLSAEWPSQDHQEINWQTVNMSGHKWTLSGLQVAARGFPKKNLVHSVCLDQGFWGNVCFKLFSNQPQSIDTNPSLNQSLFGVLTIPVIPYHQWNLSWFSEATNRQWCPQSRDITNHQSRSNNWLTHNTCTCFSGALWVNKRLYFQGNTVFTTSNTQFGVFEVQ